jgi:hypothetical protein
MQILKEETPFVHKAIAALAISIVSDALDYFAAPLFDIPVIGDVFDVITTIESNINSLTYTPR